VKQKLFHVKPKQIEPKQLIQVWRDEWQDEFAQASIIGTTAVIEKVWLHRVKRLSLKMFMSL
jgi:hypothetical protein